MKFKDDKPSTSDIVESENAVIKRIISDIDEEKNHNPTSSHTKTIHTKSGGRVHVKQNTHSKQK